MAIFNSYFDITTTIFPSSDGYFKHSLSQRSPKKWPVDGVCGVEVLMGLWICFGDIILDWIQQFEGFSSNILIYWNIFRQFHITMKFMMISLLLNKIMWFSIANCETWPADIPLIILPYLCPSNVVISVKSPIHRGDMDGYGWIWCIIQGVYPLVI